MMFGAKRWETVKSNPQNVSERRTAGGESGPANQVPNSCNHSFASFFYWTLCWWNHQIHSQLSLLFKGEKELSQRDYSGAAVITPRERDSPQISPLGVYPANLIRGSFFLFFPRHPLKKREDPVNIYKREKEEKTVVICWLLRSPSSSCPQSRQERQRPSWIVW